MKNGLASADQSTPVPYDGGEYEARITIPANVLLVGDYHVALCLWDVADMFDLQEPALSFAVEHEPSPLYAIGKRIGSKSARSGGAAGS